MTYRKKETLIVACSLLCLACSALKAVEMSSLVEQMPAQSIGEGNKIFAEMIKAGPAGIKKLCDSLVPPGTGDDTNIRFALNGLAKFVSRAGAEKQRKMFVSALLNALESTPDREVKAFLIRQLRLVGRDEVVKPLSKYLTDNRPNGLCEPAAQTLQTIGTAQVGKALLKALPSAAEVNRVTIITTLGTLRYKPAGRELLRYTDNDKLNVRQAALYAVANIGDPSAGKVLAKASRTGSHYEKSIATANYLLFVQRRAEAGDKKQCARICRDIIRSRTQAYENNIPCAALSVLVSIEGVGAIGDVLAAMDSDNVYLHGAALRLAEKIPGSAATMKWAGKMKKVSPEKRRKIITMLARRGDKKAGPAVLQTLQDKEKIVRLAAIPAAVTLAGNEALESLLGLLGKTDQSDEINAIRDSITRIPGETFTAVVAEALMRVPVKGRVALIQVIAIRGSRAQLDAIFARTKDEDGSVRLAALKSLENLSSGQDLPRLISLLVNAQGRAEQSAAQKAVVSAAGQIGDIEKRAKPLIEAMAGMDDAKRSILLGTLAKIGGVEALGVVIADTKSKSKVVSEAAIRALADWPDAGAVPELLKVIQSDNLTHQVVALRGCVRLVETANLPAAEKVRLYSSMLKAAPRLDEKKLVLAALAKIRTVKSLKHVAPYLDEKTLQNEAALAVVTIACPPGKKQKGLEGIDVYEILSKTTTVCKNAKVRQQAKKYMNAMPKPSLNRAPKGFVALFNGRDLRGWKGLLARPNDNPFKRGALSPEQLKEEQAKADKNMRDHWKVIENGVLEFDGKGFSLATDKNYEDFEMLVDWKIVNPHGDSGVYLRGTPQVQIWDPDRPGKNYGVGSGGLFNNKKNPSKPLLVADNPIGQWNTFRIKMVGERVTIFLNDELIVDNVILENYWDRSKPLFPSEQIELQCHGDPIHFRNVFIREIPRKDGWKSLFNGKDLTGWKGDTKGYVVENGTIVCKPGGNLYTVDEFSDFVLQFEFKLTDGANNGLGVRTPYPSRNAAYEAMELQILDNSAKRYRNLKPYQFHGSVYGVVPAKRGFLRPVGQWNHQEVIARGSHIVVNLNGFMIVDTDVIKASTPKTMDGKKHPGLKRKSGHLAFLGHSTRVEFRSIRVKELKSDATSQSTSPYKDETSQQRDARMKWWRQARFGMFIHWGVYSVPAGTYNDKRIGGIGEWIMKHGKIPVAEYKKYAAQFNPVKYNPDEWVRLAKKAGMKYIVITAKHHDGFALFDSKVTDWDVVDATPYGKDLLKPLAEACRKYGIKLGFYYSQAQDWCHPGGRTGSKGIPWDEAQKGDMNEYIRKIATPQVKEILTNYGDIAVLWWDTPWGMDREKADMLLPPIKLQDGILTNNRLGGDYEGDFGTPEQKIPATGMPGKDWETCMTMNGTWGYKSYDHKWKSTKTLIRNLVDIASKGGNYLLNVGPTSLGEIPQPSIDGLKEIGKWMDTNGESIYETTASPFSKLPWGRCTKKLHNNGATLYLHVFDWPSDGKLLVAGLGNKIRSARFLAGNQQVKFTTRKDGVMLNLPGQPLDSIDTVIVLEVEGKLDI